MSGAAAAAGAELPLGALSELLRREGLAGSTPLKVTPLTGGQSNPTFRIDTGSHRLVLRKQPPGPLLPSAHAVDREYRVMRALHGSAVPVPAVRLFCDDVSVVGTPFYLMDFLDGRVLADPALPGMTPAQRGEIYRETNRVIAAMHAVDVAAVGLSDYGRPGNYFARQIARWSRQATASSVAPTMALQRLMEWLPGHVPPGDETTLVHGDFRIDNLVFHATEPRVIGVLDWELSTLGHPLADFSYHCMSWHVPPSLWRGIGGLDLASLGIPSADDYVAMYAQATGRDAIEHWDFYLAYNLFRMAAILQGIAQRALEGNAASADAVETGRKAGPLAELGWALAQRYDAARG